MPPARKAPSAESDAAQLTLFAACEVLPLGDGSWRIVPGKPRQKLTVRQAARMLGGISASSVRRLYHAREIEGEQPTPRTILLFAESVDAHLKRTRSGEHWTAARRQKMRS